MTQSRVRRLRPAFLLAIAALVTVVAGATAIVAQSKKEFAVTGKKYTYVVSGPGTSEIHVQQDDFVKITFSTEDIPHSFTTAGPDDHYRIDRRAEPGKPVMFQFRADKPGRFEIRCNLTIDERCQRDMRAWLIVDAKK